MNEIDLALPFPKKCYLIFAQIAAVTDKTETPSLLDMEEPYLRSLKEFTFKLKLTVKTILDKLDLSDLYLYGPEEKKEAPPLSEEELRKFLTI